MATPSADTPTPPGPLTDLRTWVRGNAGLSAGELIDALQRDQQLRWENGEWVPAEAYLQILAAAGRHAAADEQALDLIYSEVLLRRDRGEAPTLREYSGRFPELETRLRLLLDLDQRMWGGGARSPAPGDHAAPMADRPSRTLPQVDGYEVGEEIGRGGMGVVYRARHLALNRVVALKLVPAVDAEGWARFRVEAESVAGLQHPNIVQIFEVGETDDGRGGCPYMALEFVAGGSLARRLAGPPIPPRATAALVETVARAVHFAHQRGIIHRDLKPGNVLLFGVTAAPDGGLPTPKVADFGLAKRLEEDGSDRTRTGAVLGTPGYMAPEQLAGNGSTVGTPADVYALGAILYECLAGRPPFQGQNALDTLAQVRSRDPVPPRRLRAGVPRDLETICLTCLRKEPERRYASAAALADDLGRFLAGKPILARRTGPAGRAVRWCRRNPALAAAVAAGVLAVAAVATAGVVQVVRERDRYRGERDQARANLYRALVGEARAVMKARETAWWWRAMDNLRAAAALDVAGRDDAELRDLAIECMGVEDPCFRADGTWEGHTGPVTAAACRADGRVAATGSRDATVRLWSVPDGRPLAVLTGHSKTVTGVAFAPDGRHLASGSADGTVRLWDVTTPNRPPVRVFDPHAGPVSQVAVSPDGVWLAAGCGDGGVRLFQAAGDRPARVLTGHTGPVTCVEFSPAGELASGGSDLTIRFWHITAAKQVRSWTVLNSPSALAFSPPPETDRLAWSDLAGSRFSVRYFQRDLTASSINGHAGGVTQVLPIPRSNLWVSASADGTLELWRQLTGLLQDAAVARGEFGPVHAAALVPGGGGVIAGYADGRVRLWRIEEPPQRAWVGQYSHNAAFAGGRRLVDPERLTDLSAGLPGAWRKYAPGTVRAMAMDPAGRTLALGRDDGTLEAWAWPARHEIAKWAGHDRAVAGLAAGPDGRFASASADGTVKLWRPGASTPERSLAADVGALHGVAWGTDGRFLAACGERGVALWDTPGSGPITVLSARSLPVSAVAIGGTVVAFSEADGLIEVRDLPSGAVRRLRGHTAPVAVLAFSPDGSRLASAAADGSIRIWDPATGDEVQKITADVPGRSLAIDRTGRYLLCTSLNENLFDLGARRPAAHLYGVQKHPSAACISPDGADLVLAGDNGGVVACPLADVARVRAAAGDPAAAVRVDVPAPFVPGGHAHGVWGIAASPDGRWVATAGHDRTVKVWDAATMALVRTLDGHPDVVWSVAFSPDSKLLASGSASEKAGDVRVWDVETGRPVWRFEGHERLVTGLAFHPHRPWLASGSLDGSVRLWDVARGESLGPVHRFDVPVHDLAFRPDGRRLAAATGGPRVAVWDVGDAPPAGPPTRLAAGHTAGVRSVAFSPDGRVLASGSDQGVVLMWDGDTAARLATLRGGKGQVRGLSFSPDGGLLAAAGYTTSTVVWDLAAVRRTLREMNLDW